LVRVDLASLGGRIASVTTATSGIRAATVPRLAAERGRIELAMTGQAEVRAALGVGGAAIATNVAQTAPTNSPETAERAAVVCLGARSSVDEAILATFLLQAIVLEHATTAAAGAALGAFQLGFAADVGVDASSVDAELRTAVERLGARCRVRRAGAHGAR
jgi:hypothetical protein